MPGWMNEAVAKGAFNSVVNTDGSEIWKVSAGSAVGFMGLNEVPGVGQLVEQERFIHLEVMSVDSRMTAFLANPASVNNAGKLIRTIAGKKMHLRNGETNPPTFTASEVALASGALVSRESTSPIKDAAGKWWFKVSDNGWMPQADVEEIEQYDLLKQGFYPLAEDSDGDIMHTFMEGWVSEAFGQVAEVSGGNNSSPLSARVPEYYRTMMAKLDENKDGKVSADEIRRALSRRDPQVRNIIDRLVIKHHSEWIGGPSAERWKGFYRILDKLSIPFCTRWQSGNEWMSQVDAFKEGKPVWHMHPVVFMSSLNDANDQLITYEQLKQMLPSDQEDKVNVYLGPLNETMALFEINTPLRKSHFMAQVLHETESFKYSEETASGRAYEGRSDLGNNQDGDGPLFKGRGLLQITGRSNYTRCQQYLRGKLNDPLFDITSSVSSAKQLSDSARFSALASGYFWKFIKPKLNDVADKDDIYWVSVYVNGWAVQSHPYYPEKAKEPNHMAQRIRKLSVTKRAFELE
jgi:predicted chitinase